MQWFSRVLACVVVLLAATKAQAQVGGLVPLKPDLIISKVQPSLGSLKITVMNKGLGVAAPCKLSVKVYRANQLVKSFTMPVPKLGRFQSTVLQANLGGIVLLPGMRVVMEVDASHVVPESNELNNKRVYQLPSPFGG